MREGGRLSGETRREDRERWRETVREGRESEGLRKMEIMRERSITPCSIQPGRRFHVCAVK